MTTCTRCAAELSVGRFCTNCGAPRAETPVVASTPPPVHMAPPPQRFPLYADEHGRYDDEASTLTQPASVPLLLSPEPGGRSPHTRRRKWVMASAVVLVLLAAVGLSLMSAGSDEDDPAAPAPVATGSQTAPTFDGEPEQLSGLATGEAPRSDADSVDISTGEPTTYRPDNMLDGDPETSWRVSGDASGETLRFTFDQPVTLTSVGLVNGYAKTSVDRSGTEFDLYAGSRRVLEVEWVLDGGEPLPQTLTDGDRELQLLDVGAVEASVVELRLVRVSAPGEGVEARDKTVISEVSLSGYEG